MPECLHKISIIKYVTYNKKEEDLIKRPSPEHIKAILDLINQGLYFKHLAMEVRKLDIGSCIVEVNLYERHLNPFGGAPWWSVRFRDRYRRILRGLL